MSKFYAPHLAIIRESIAAIERYRPADRETFLATPLMQDAVLMRLQVIGEHLARMRRIDEERFAQVAPESWYQVIGLRNVISHRRSRVWRTGLVDLPCEWTGSCLAGSEDACQHLRTLSR